MALNYSCCTFCAACALLGSVSLVSRSSRNFAIDVGFHVLTIGRVEPSGVVSSTVLVCVSRGYSRCI